MKVTVVTSNENPEIAMNYETKRMTHSFIAFRPPADFDWANANLTRRDAALLVPELGERALQTMMTRPMYGTGYFTTFIGLEDEAAMKLASRLFVNLTASKVSMSESVCVFVRQLLMSIANGRKIQGVQVVVPAYFTIPQRDQLWDILRAAGASGVRIVDDVVAASCTYANLKSERFKDTGRNVLFVDIGATSIKGYVVKFENVGEEVVAQRLAYSFDPDNGGAFISSAIVEYLVDKMELGRADDADKRRLLEAAEKLKKGLTVANRSAVMVELDGADVEVILTIEELEQISGPFMESLSRVIEEVSKVSFDEVEVVGGASRAQFVARFLQERVGMKIGKSFNADEMLANGASYSGQFDRDMSLFRNVRCEDHASVYSIAIVAPSGLSVACEKNGKCLSSLVIDGSSRYIVVKYEAGEVRQGLNIRSFVYTLEPQANDTEVEFVNGPFDVLKGRSCEGSDCRDVPVVSLSERYVASTVVKAIIASDKKRARTAYAHNRLEHLLDKVGDEVTNNVSIRVFSSWSNREAVRRELNETRKWLFENVNDADFSNFTTIVNKIEKMMTPIYQRIDENRSLYESMEFCDAAMRIIRKSVNKEWPKRGIEGTMEFMGDLEEAREWERDTRYSIGRRVLSEDQVELRSDEIRKKCADLYFAWERINISTPQPRPPPTPIPTPTSTPEPPRPTEPPVSAFFDAIYDMFSKKKKVSEENL